MTIHHTRPSLPQPTISLAAAAALAGAAGMAWQLQQAQLWPAGHARAACLGAALLLGVLALFAFLGGPARPGPWHPSAEPSLARRVAEGLRRASIVALAAAAGFTLGYASTDLRATHRLADRLDPQVEGRDLVVTGVIAGLPRTVRTGTRFAFDVETVRAPDGMPVEGVPQRLWLAWFHGVEPASAEGPAASGAEDSSPRAFRLSPAPEPALRAGDRWEMSVRLKRPHGGMNPQGFDLELWMFERGLGASGTVRPPGRHLQQGAAHPVDRLRQRLRDAIVAQVPDPRTAGIVAALVVGDQAAISAGDWELFRQSGVAHLMSISGLHVTMFAWLAGAVLGFCWRSHARLMLAVPAPTAARWGGLLMATAYAVLAGWGVPAQRTVLMLAVVVVLRSAGRQWSGPLVLLAAGGVVSLVDPWALLQPGFWLSFVAVGVLMAGEVDARSSPAGAREPAVDDPTASSRWRRMMGRGVGRAEQEALAMVRTQALATVGLAPLTLIFFQQMSLAGALANLFAIPYVTLVVTPLALLGVVLPPLWSAAAAAMGWLLPVLEALAAMPGAVWVVPVAPDWAVIASVVGAAVAVLPLPAWMRIAGLPLLLPLCWPPLERPPEGTFEVVMADVGQGTAVVVRTRQHLLVYDTGPVYTPEADAGQRVLVPMLRGRGDRVVHHLVLSHRDADHIGGAESLMSAFPVERVSSSLDPSDSAVPAWPPGRDLTLRTVAARLADASHTRCAEGQSWHWDGVRFEIIHPLSWETPVRKANALSCVVRVVAADGTSLLLTGDIEAAQERALVRAHGEALRSTVMTVPHHGSRTSSTPAFLDAVAPRVALVQAAYRSPFGHPAPDVVERYAARGIEVVRSDRCGAWTWHSAQEDAGRSQVVSHPPAESGRATPGPWGPSQSVGVCERQRRARYWHWQAAASP